MLQHRQLLLLPLSVRKQKGKHVFSIINVMSCNKLFVNVTSDTATDIWSGLLKPTRIWPAGWRWLPATEVVIKSNWFLLRLPEREREGKKEKHFSSIKCGKSLFAATTAWKIDTVLKGGRNINGNGSGDNKTISECGNKISKREQFKQVLSAEKTKTSNLSSNAGY